MKVLVTGGTGVVGRATVTALVDRGHTVRLLSRNARRDAAQWGSAVESWSGDVAKDDGLVGVTDGCDAVLHVVGVVQASEGGPSIREINVEGTQRIRDGQDVTVASVTIDDASGELKQADAGDSAKPQTGGADKNVITGSTK